MVLVFAAGLALFGQPNAIRYFYDDNSQLFRALDSAGTLVEYVYDPVGNILEIKRSTVAPTALSILNVTPQYAKPGATIRIYGQNFSPAVAGNVVRLNGIAATVLSASATELTLVVPTGDTTGPVTVTVAGQTATSGALVFRGVKIPVITKVTPATPVEPGAPFSIVIEGTDLEEATFGTFPDGGFTWQVAPNAFGSPLAAQAYAGLPGTYAVVATNVAGASSTTITAANQLRVGDTLGSKEALSKMISLQNGAIQTLGYPAGRSEAISKQVSVQNGAAESLGYPVGRKEANARITSVQNGVLGTFGFRPGTSESFGAVTSVRNGTLSVPSNSANQAGVQVREIQLNYAKLDETGVLPIGAGETVAFRVADLVEPRILLADIPLHADPENPTQWTVTIPAHLRELGLRIEGVAPSGEAVRVGTRVEVRPETYRSIQARVVDETGAALVDSVVSVAQSGWTAEYFDLRQSPEQLPALDNLNVSVRRNLSGLHLRNLGAVLGRDPWNLQLFPHLAVRARSRLRVSEDGLHRFLLRAPIGTRIQIGGEVAEVLSGASSIALELNLTKGEVPLEVAWVEAENAEAVEIFYAVPGGSLQGIPSAALRGEIDQLARTGPDGTLTTEPFSSAVSAVRFTLAPANSGIIGQTENSWLVPVREVDAGAVTLRKVVVAATQN